MVQPSNYKTFNEQGVQEDPEELDQTPVNQVVDNTGSLGVQYPTGIEQSSQNTVNYQDTFDIDVNQDDDDLDRDVTTLKKLGPRHNQGATPKVNKVGQHVHDSLDKHDDHGKHDGHDKIVRATDKQTGAKPKRLKSKDLTLPPPA